MAKLVINDEVKERGTSIIVNSQDDFIQLCKITGIKMSDDLRYIELTVENESGLTNTSRIYLPKEESEYSESSKYEMAVNIFVRNMANILRRFKGENASVEADNVVQLAQKVIAAVTPLLHSKKVYTLFELNENDKGIFTRIAGIAPFADNPKDLFVSKKQLQLLEKKNGTGVTPDNDANFMATPTKVEGNKPPF